MSRSGTDVAILIDPRFMGGTAIAVDNDVRSFLGFGAKVGLYFIRSTRFFQPTDTVNPILPALLDRDGVTDLSGASEIDAPITFFHHPMTFLSPVENPIQVNSPKSVIVTHTAPFKGDGAMEFDPFLVQRVIERQFGARPFWAPISGLCRRQFRSFAPLLRLTSLDWPNTFHTEEWSPQREKLTSPHLMVGRHGRPHMDKWGDSGEQIGQCLPAGPHTKIRTMGAPKDFFEALGLDTSEWDVLGFNAEPVPDFLDSLDVFSYFHASSFTETFGRTVAEAMLMGARCILKPSLSETFGKHAIYCEPHEVSSVIERIRNDLAGEREAAAAAREHCLAAYSTATIEGRLAALLADPGTRSRAGGTSVSPLLAARRWTGFHRRRRRQLQEEAH